MHYRSWQYVGNMEFENATHLTSRRTTAGMQGKAGMLIVTQ
jgi:hypothetical protein